jgi:hypothetical protein
MVIEVVIRFKFPALKYISIEMRFLSPKELGFVS